MAYLGLEVEETEAIDKYFMEVKERLKSNDVARNPFNGCLFKIKERKALYIIVMSPLWPRFYITGVLPLLLGLVLNIEWIIIGGLLILSMAFFWSNTFIYLMLKMGLRKKHIRTKLKKVKTDELLTRLIKLHTIVI